MVEQNPVSTSPGPAQEQGPALTILIVNRNSAGYLADCLRSILATLGDVPTELILVDGSSSDDSVAVARRLWPSVKVLSVPEKLGYVRANNVGLKEAKGRYTMYLNSDTVIYPGTFQELVGFLDGHPEVGAASGAILNADGSDQGVVRRFPSVMNGIFGRRSWLSRVFPNNRWYKRYMQSRSEHGGEPFETEILSAASMVVRTALARELGGMDERFRFYWVDVEMCCRIARRGFRVWCVPRAKILHYEGKGGSTGSFWKRMEMNLAFNQGAYLAYASYHRLGRFDPRRLLVKLVLMVRTLVLAGVQVLEPSKATSSGGRN